MNWKEPPYNHTKWEKKHDSIFSPETKVTWPQFIVEMVIFWRTKILKDYPEIKKGKGWSRAIAGQVRSLEHQATVICNYFPHPDLEPLVVYAVKKFFRTRRPLKLGGFRKNRTKISEAGNEVCIVSQDEKDIVLGIQDELTKVMQSRELYNDIKPTVHKAAEDVTFDTSQPKRKTGLAYLIELERQIKSAIPKAE